MQGEWRGTDQDPGGDFVQSLFSQFVSAYLLTVLPPDGEDAHQEGEGGHDYLCDTSSTFGHFLILTSQGWVAQNSPWLRNTFLKIDFECILLEEPFDTQLCLFLLI